MVPVARQCSQSSLHPPHMAVIGRNIDVAGSCAEREIAQEVNL